MKRFATLSAVLMTLVLVLSLAACGSDETTTEPTDTDTTTQSETQEPENTETDAQTTGAVDLAALRDKMVSDYQLTDVLEVETPALETAYGISADLVKSSASFNASSGAAFPQEIVMVEAVDETAAADVASKLENRLSSIAEQAASYDPDSLALAEKCKVVTDGVYVGMFFSSNYDGMVADFQAAV